MLRQDAMKRQYIPKAAAPTVASWLQRTKKDQAELADAIKLLQRADLVRLGEFIHRQVSWLALPLVCC